jgi:hypothetical protein
MIPNFSQKELEGGSDNGRCGAGRSWRTPPSNVNTTQRTAKQRVIMASFNRERVEHALNELIVRIVPEDADDDEDVANERFDEAFEFAISTLSGAEDPPLVPDVDHIADLIDNRSRCAVCPVFTVPG